MKKGIAVLVFVAGCVLAVYLGVVVCLIGGVVDVVDGIKADPTNGGQIVLGVVLVTVAPVVTALVFGVATAIASFLGFSGPSKRLQSRARRRANRMAGLPDEFGGDVDDLARDVAQQGLFERRRSTR